MRPIRLARIAAEAEVVRFKALAQRTIIRIVCAVLALLFVIGAVVFAHLAAWYWLRAGLSLSQYASIAVLGGFDLLVAAALGVYASRSGPSRVEREAIEVRRTAVAGIGSVLSLAQLAVPAWRVASSVRRRSRRRP